MNSNGGLNLLSLLSKSKAPKVKWVIKNYYNWNDTEQTAWSELLCDILPEGKGKYFYGNLNEKDTKIITSQL